MLALVLVRDAILSDYLAGVALEVNCANIREWITRTKISVLKVCEMKSIV